MTQSVTCHTSIMIDMEIHIEVSYHIKYCKLAPLNIQVFVMSSNLHPSYTGFIHWITHSNTNSKVAGLNIVLAFVSLRFVKISDMYTYTAEHF